MEHLMNYPEINEKELSRINGGWVWVIPVIKYGVPAAIAAGAYIGSKLK
ncbi:MAG: hypothetical protein LBS33_06780 [Streptococcaceae bacterium]|jgi:bacteriocin-like protein|nr:hypothetical protein [Streptococcaceae bacterium]